MHLVILIDHRYQRQPDGGVRSPTHYNYELIKRRYGSVFDQVDLLTRVDDGQVGRYRLGPGVDVVSLGNWTGGLGYFRARSRIRAALKAHLVPGKAVNIVAPGALADAAFPLLAERGMPFGVEVIGNAFEFFSSGSSRHPLRRLIQQGYDRSLKRICRHAAVASYVTERSLQRRYPAVSAIYTTHYSSIELSRTHFAPPRIFSKTDRRRIVCIGAMAELRKGQDDLIRAVALCRQSGLDVSLSLVGEGRKRPELEALTRSLGMDSFITFHGQLPPGEAIHRALDQSDLYVLPSRGEGLPRSIIEAMARGLPCLATNISGMSELLPAESLFPPNRPSALAAAISELVQDPGRMTTESKRNHEKAADYRDDLLTPRRHKYYEMLRDVCGHTGEYLKAAS